MLKLLFVFLICFTAATFAASVTYHDCGCKDANCTTISFSESSCQIGSPAGSGFVATKITCQSSLQKCALLVFFNDSSCTQYNQVISPVCGACEKISATTSYQVQCDQHREFVNASKCNADCSVCSQSATHLFEQCSPDLSGDFHIVNAGVAPCAAVKVEQWKSSVSCTGTPDATTLVGQGVCSRQGLFTCDTQPTLPPAQVTSNTSVLVSTCPWGRGCIGDCSYQSVSSGSCMQQPMGRSSRTTCLAGSRQCVILAGYRKQNCQPENVQFLFSPACNSCSRSPHSDGTFSYVRCDTKTGTATWDMECDSTCTTCAKPDAGIRPIYHCTAGLYPDMSIFNFGIVPCNTVQNELFDSANCAPNSIKGNFTVAADQCEGSGRYSCGDYDLQSVTIQECFCNSTACPPYTIPAGKCQSNSTTSWSIQCLQEKKTCANLIMFQDASCTNFQQLLTPVCDSCFAFNNSFMKITCDPNDQSTTGLMNCDDSNCNNCQHASAFPHKYSKCSPGVIPGSYIYNQGLTECDAVAVSFWNSSGACQGLPSTLTVRSEEACFWGQRITCGKRPFFNEPAASNTSVQIVETHCSSHWCSGQCNQTYHSNGVCNSNAAHIGKGGWPIQATRYTCQGSGICVTVIYYQGTSCDDKTKAKGWATGVCGSCTSKYNSTSFLRTRCDVVNNYVWVDEECDSQCKQCNKTHVNPIGVGECKKSEIWSNMMILSGGFHQCKTIRLETFSNAACDAGALVGNWSMGAGECEYGYSFHCGNSFTIPATSKRANVSEELCGCDQMGPTLCNHQIKKYPSETCHANPYDIVNKSSSYSVGCPVGTQQCVQIAFFMDSTCKHYAGVSTGVCGSCINGPDGVYYKIVCDKATQKVTTYGQCDPTCSKCYSPLPVEHKFNECSQSLMPTMWVKNFGIEECDAVVFNWYPKSNSCQGTAQLGWMQQYTCGGGLRLFCDNAAAALPAEPSNDLLYTKCDDDKFCSRNCISTRVKADKCVVRDNGKTSFRVSCTGWGHGTCAQVAFFSSSTCNYTKFEGFYSIACGTCTMYNGKYMKTNCNTHNQSFSVDFDCDSGCVICKSTNLQRPIDTCVVDVFNDGGYLKNIGVSPCTTVSYQEYNGTECADKHLSLKATISTQGCFGGERFQCGDYSPTPPTPTQAISYFDCGCNPNAMNCSSQTFAQQTCTSKLSKQGGSAQVTCMGTMQTCASLVLFADSKCSKNYLLAFASVCNSCVKFGPEWYHFDCDTSTQAITMRLNCSDSTCGSCSGKTLTFQIDQCGIWPEAPFTYILNQGLSACPAVQVQQWFSNTQCNGAPDNSYVAAQGSCSVHGMYTCSIQPSLPPVTAAQPRVLISECSGGGCVGQCSYQSVPSGGCTLNSYGSFETRCTTEMAQCTTLVIYNGTTCSMADFRFMYSAVCNKCNKFAGLSGYSFIRCDNSTGDVALSTGCDETCTRCSNVDKSYRPLYKCVAGLMPLSWVVNFGITPCQTIEQDFYSSPTCAAGTKKGSFHFGDGFCSGMQEMRCGNFTMQEVTLRSCNPKYPYNFSFPSGTCQRNPNPSLTNSSYMVTCTTKRSKCVNVAVFNSSDCAHHTWLEMASPVCGSCMKPHTASLGYIKIDCDSTLQTSTTTTGCDSHCQNCDPKTALVHKRLQCSPGLQPGFGIFVHSVSDCDAVIEKVWDNNTECLGSPDVILARAEGVCAWESQVVCANAPGLNQSVVQAETQVLHTICRDRWCTQNCSQSIHRSGVCFATNHRHHHWHHHSSNNTSGHDFHMPIHNSSRFTCQPATRCANMIFFNNSNVCQGEPMGRFSPVCNRCSKGMFGYGRVRCDFVSQDVWYDMECDPQCNVCNKTHSTSRKLNDCSAGLFPNTMIVNRGVYPCNAVEIQYFASNDCDEQAITARFFMSEGACDLHGSYQCGTFSLPDSDLHGEYTIREDECICDDCHVGKTYEANTCQTYTGHHWNGSYSVSCMRETQMCATMNFWQDSKCYANFSTIGEPVCNSCFEGPNGVYYKISCDIVKQLVSVVGHCDSMCSNCQSVQPHSYPLGKCAKGLFDDYTQNMGIAPCKAVAVMRYSNVNNCQGQPNFALMQSEYTCGWGHRYSCSNTPAPITQPHALNKVLRTECPGVFCGGVNCTSTVASNGACTAVSASQNNWGVPIVARRASCLVQSGLCVTVINYKKSTCQLKDFDRVDTIACNTCSQFGTGAFWRVDCNYTSQTTVISQNCDSTCSNCQFKSTLSQMQCVKDPNPNVTSIYWSSQNIFPCGLINIQEYSTSTCDSTSINLNYTAAVGACEGSVRYECGEDFNLVIPPNPTASGAPLPSTQPTGPAAPSTTKKGVPSGEVVGIILGGLAGLVILVGIFFLYRRHQASTTTTAQVGEQEQRWNGMDYSALN